MLIDKLKLFRTIIQINYDEAYILWDKAGQISKTMTQLWKDKNLQLGRQTSPNLQVLESETMTIASRLNQATITLNGLHSLDDSTIDRLTKTLKIWITELEIDELTRLSMRMINHIEYPSIAEANKELLSLGLIKFPEEKVFGQSPDSEQNTAELTYRFQTDEYFTYLRLSTDEVIYEFTNNPEVEIDIDFSKRKIFKNRLIVDFDRGLLTKTPTNKLIIDDWIKGNIHTFRRDITKVLGK